MLQNTSSYRSSLVQLFVLALPMVISNVGRILLQSIDNIMVGQLGPAALAAILLANSVFWLPLVLGDGLCRGIVPLIAAAHAQEKPRKVGALLQHALLMNSMVGLLLVGGTQLVASLLCHVKQDVTVVELAIPYLQIISFSLIPFMVFRTIEKYLQALLNPRPCMYIALIGMAANIILNYLLIYGKAGFPRMELIGAGWATLFSRLVMMGLSIIFLVSSQGSRQYLAFFSRQQLSFTYIKKILKVGIPSSLQMTTEVIAFTILVFIAGWISVEAQATHAILTNLSLLVYVAANGISSALSAQMGHHWGIRNHTLLNKTSKVGFLAGSIFIGGMLLLLLVGNSLIPTLFTNDETIHTMTHMMLPLLALFIIPDGLNAIAIGILRGMQDVTIPTWVTLVSNWLINIPIVYFLAFTLNWGLSGIWWGVTVGMTFSAIVLWIRIYKKTTSKTFSSS